MTSKHIVRTAMRRLRQGLDPVERQERSHRSAERVLFYAAQGDEVDTFPLLTRWVADGRRAIFPRMEGKEIVDDWPGL